MATKPAKTADSSERSEETADRPVLDSLTAAVRKLVSRGKERGYVTYDDLNEALPPDEVSSEQIEDTMTMLSEMGINVVDSEDSEEATTANAAAEEPVFYHLQRSGAPGLPAADTSPGERPTTQSGANE